MLNIKGTGFVEDKSRIKVTVDNRDCEVRQIVNSMIKCRLSNSQTGSSKLSTNKNGTQEKPYIGGSGWNLTRYNYFSFGSVKDLKEMIDSGNYESRKNYEGRSTKEGTSF